MTQTFGQRRRQEQHQLEEEEREEQRRDEQRREEQRDAEEESTESEEPEGGGAEASAIKSKTRKTPVEDQGIAATSSRRTTDRVLSALREGTAEMLTQMNKNLEDEAKRKNKWEEKWLAAEEKKTSLVKEWLQAQREKPLESEREKLKQDITAEVTAKFEEKFAAQQTALENIQAMLRSMAGGGE
jgi:hypothetical protein